MTVYFVDPNSVHDPATGLAAPAAWGDNMRDNVVAALQAPSVRVRRNAVQSIPHDTLTTVAFDLESFDLYDMHDNVTNNPRLTIPTNWGGHYMVGASVRWGISTAGTRRYAEIVVNSGAIKVDDDDKDPGLSGYVTNKVSTMWSAVPGDYFQLRVYQDSGGNLDVISDGYAGTFFWAAFQTLRDDAV